MILNFEIWGTTQFYNKVKWRSKSTQIYSPRKKMNHELFKVLKSLCFLNPLQKKEIKGGWWLPINLWSVKTAPQATNWKMMAWSIDLNLTQCCLCPNLEVCCHAGLATMELHSPSPSSKRRRTQRKVVELTQWGDCFGEARRLKSNTVLAFLNCLFSSSIFYTYFLIII